MIDDALAELCRERRQGLERLCHRTEDDLQDAQSSGEYAMEDAHRRRVTDIHPQHRSCLVPDEHPYKHGSQGPQDPNPQEIILDDLQQAVG